MGLQENMIHLEARLEEVGLDLSIYDSCPSKYIRVNPRNRLVPRELQRQLSEDYGVQTRFIPTSVQGVYRSTNPEIGGLIGGNKNDLFMKHYFIQDLTSVLAVNALALSQGNTVLDLCAAPGFKSLFASDFARVDLTCVEVDEKRFLSMQSRFGDLDVKATLHNADSLHCSLGLYDRVLVDPSCSCEGMIVKYDSTLLKEVSGLQKVLSYSQDDVLVFSLKQRQLLQKGFDHLKQEGVLVYSTCALNRIENESVIGAFLSQNPNAEVSLPPVSGVDYRFSDYGIRIHPGATRGSYFTRIVKV